MILCLLLTAAACIAALAEEENTENAQNETEEQGYQELQALMEISQIEQAEGMNLEEATESFDLSVMSEYYDSATGFSMQYPSVFQFDEEKEIPTASTTDGKAQLTIENYSSSGDLTEEMLLEAIRLENPDGEVKKNAENGSLRTDRSTDGGQRKQTDIYFVSAKSFHHIIIQFPAEEAATYDPYIEYMINSLTTEETDLG